MEINEKLDIFYEAAIAAANKQSEEILEEQKRTYQQAIETYERNKQEEQKLWERAMEAKIKKEANRSISEQMLQQKRIYHAAEEAKKEELFAIVEEKLRAFRNTRQYEEFLIHHIRQAEAYGRGEEAVICLSPSDAGKKAVLEQETGVELTLSEEEFYGGIRAVFPGKHMLMDESFAGRLRQEREGYTWA